MCEFSKDVVKASKAVHWVNIGKQEAGGFRQKQVGGFGFYID